MVKFKHESQETETKYCMVVRSFGLLSVVRPLTTGTKNNPDDDNTIFLAVNGLRNQWAMCSNTKAAGRFELVWAPIKGHKDYSYDTCQSIILVAEKCEDPDEDGEVEGDYEGDEDDYEGDGGKEAEGNKEDEGDKEDEETMEEATN
jgi:hypothetical protein